MKKDINDIPVIKTFVYENNYFIYDVYNNRLFGVSKAQFVEINQLLIIGLTNYCNLKKDTQAYKDILMLINKGYMKKPFIEKIEHPETEFIQYLVERRINDMSFQVTRDCNFKCRYCLYANNSGIERSHENQYMPWDTAKRCINFLFNHSLDAEIIRLSFYGGEPLLNFKLITNIVNYAEKLFNTKKIEYRMTINGSILTNDMLDFIVKYNFMIAISLDGPENIQNSHRKFYESGDGTFNIVYKNVKKLKDKYEDYFNTNVTFMPVVFADENRYDVLNFFKEFNKYEDNVFPQNAALGGIDYIINSSNVYNSDTMMIDEQNNKINKNAETIFKMLYNDKSSIPIKWHHGGPCIPGVRRLFADVNGVFYPCEKIVEHDCLSIGNVEYGLNLERIVEFLNIGKLTEEECKSCWAIRYCDICIAQCNDVDKHKITSNQKHIACDKLKYKTMVLIKQYIKENYISKH